MLSSGFMESIYNIIQCIPKTSQICLFSATLPQEILQLTEYFMIGTFITPIKAKHDEILIAFCLSKIRHDNK